MKQLGLTPDQFQFDADGNVVISHDEIAETIRHQQVAMAALPEEAWEISIGITIEF